MFFPRSPPHPTPAVSLLRLPRRRTRRWVGAMCATRTVGQWCAGVFSISLALPQSGARSQRKPLWARCFRRRGSTARPLVAYGAISFGCGMYDDDVLSTVASESEDLLADTCGSLPPGGHERRSSPSYSELLEVVTARVDKLELDWEVDPNLNWTTVS